MENIPQRIKDIQEFSVAIDSWDDIFSDFDPNPLNKRTVSGDFIDELRKRYGEAKGKDFSVIIFAPFKFKNKDSEKMVAQRLKKHFKYKALLNKKALNRLRKKGFIFITVGVLSLLFLTIITYKQVFSGLMIEILGIPLMPLGWFGIWEGISKLVDTSPSSLQESAFFERLSKASYNFRYIEE